MRVDVLTAELVENLNLQLLKSFHIGQTTELVNRCRHVRFSIHGHERNAYACRQYIKQRNVREQASATRFIVKDKEIISSWKRKNNFGWGTFSSGMIARLTGLPSNCLHENFVFLVHMYSGERWNEVVIIPDSESRVYRAYYIRRPYCIASKLS